MQQNHTVVFVAYSGVQLLDLAGPLEVFDGARRAGDHISYQKIIATVDGAPIVTSSGISLAADTSLSAIAEPIDTLLVLGGPTATDISEDHGFVDALAAACRLSTRLGSVCSGTIPLAATGMLDNYRVTSHWSVCDELAHRFPNVVVEPDRIYVHDRNRWTSAGVTAGIDLALALVGDDHGPEIAHTIARWMVVFARRPGGQSQFSTHLKSQVAQTSGIRTVQGWIADHIAGDLSIKSLAERARMSERTFARRFHTEIGITAGEYVEQARLEASCSLLETTDLTIEAVAKTVGYRHGETLHRVFVRRLSTTPDSYRQHFARASGPAPSS